MIRAAALALIGALASGQSLTLTSGATVVPAGSPVTLNLNMVTGGGPAALQFGITGLPAGATVAVPAALTTKTVTCNFPANITPICLIIAPNTVAQPLTQASGLAAIPDGAVAVITYTQPASTPATVAVPSMTVFPASPAGTGYAIAPPAAPITVGIQSHCDVNGDGAINSTDVGLVVQAVLAGGTGAPTALDVVREIIAAFGGACLR